MDIQSSNKQVNPSEPFTQPGQSSTKTQSKLFPIILGTLVLLIIVGTGAYYLGTQQNKPTPANLDASPSPTITTTYQATPIPTTGEEKEFKTRYYNPTDLFFDTTLTKEKYPAELTQMPDSSLTLISCTSLYSGYGKNYFSSYDGKRTPLTDSSLLNYIQTLNKKYIGKPQSEITEILACSPETWKKVILYSLGPCGGGCSGIPYVGVVDDTNIHEVKGLKGDGIPYYGCRQPLQLTQDGMFYFQCGGGDGPGISSTIYRLSLNDLLLSRVRNCVKNVDESGKSYSKCE